MHVYTSGHKHSVVVCQAFAAGAGLSVVQAREGLKLGGVFTYGNLRGLKNVLDIAIVRQREWIYADNGYFRPGHYDGYYRVTRNAYQHDGHGTVGAERWQRLGKQIMSWKRGGKFVLVCPPGDVYAQLHAFDNARWLRETLEQLERSTDREIVIRRKPAKGERITPLWDALRGCHALVTHSSNSAVEALLYGVPVFCTAPCAAQAMGSADVCTIDSPRYPDDRERWAHVLAANQWTLDEMRDGTCWRQLTEGR